MCAEACYCSLAAVAAVRFCAPAPLSASQKCLCKQAFLLHGIIRSVDYTERAYGADEKYILPDIMFSGIYDIDADFFKSRGIDTVILDIDNTLVTYGDPEPTEPVCRWIEGLRSAGLNIAVASNNKKERVELFCRKIDTFLHTAAVSPRENAFGSAVRNSARCRSAAPLSATRYSRMCSAQGARAHMPCSLRR